jgi:hypothetical protein
MELTSLNVIGWIVGVDVTPLDGVGDASSPSQLVKLITGDSTRNTVINNMSLFIGTLYTTEFIEAI